MSRYEDLKRFLKVYTETMFDLYSYPEEDRPMSVLAEFERQSPALGRKALRISVADAVSNLRDLSAPELESLSAALAAANAPSVASVRALVSKKLGPVIKRGVLRNEEEFYLVKDLLDSPSLPDDERTKLETMLDTFEFSR
jgi:hypothetical protein